MVISPDLKESAANRQLQLLLPPLPLLNNTQRLKMLTNAKNDNYFFLDANKLIHLLSYIADGNWYRAQVKDYIPATTAKVMFLDYGNLEEVSVDKLCRIPSSFLELPFQAICCSLSGEYFST